MARFAETVDEYRAQVLRIDRDAIAATVASLLPAGGRVVTPATCRASGSTDSTRSATTPPRPCGRALEDAAAVVTGCALGIAATGTIVLDAGVAQGRRVLTLSPTITSASCSPTRSSTPFRRLLRPWTRCAP